MSTSALTFADLKNAIREMGERYPHYGDDDLFVLWFLRAYVTDRDEAAAEAITGGSRDKGVDALLIDDASRSVVVVQAKYRQKQTDKTEERNDVIAFAELASLLNGWNDEPFQAFASDTDAAVAERLRRARKKIQKEGYRTWLYFVTTAKVSPTVRKDVEKQVQRVGGQARIEVIDGNRALLLFRDYLDGVAPPIPTLELEMEVGSGVTVNGVSQRFDHRTKVESWVFSMRGDAVAAIYERAGLRLFARNVRGFLGASTAINEGMEETLKTEPERFFFYNNGITIVCDQAEKKSSHGKDILLVGNPQVINGQQTTRTLAASPQNAARASVLVKVIRVPRLADAPGEQFEGLVSRIVAGTNWQNAIKPSDLMANDRKQIELERALRKVGYLYLRKRQSKEEAKRLVGRGQFLLVSKEELAQAVAGCDLDPVIIRSGRDNLFTEEHYDQVFPNSDPEYFLPRYRLMREVTRCGKGQPARGYAKWLVMNFVWTHLSPKIRGRLRSRAFTLMLERQRQDVLTPLKRVIDLAFVQALKYFKESRGVGDAALDVSQFFKNRKGHHLRFAEFWDAAAVTPKTTFTTGLMKIHDAVASFEG